MSCLNGSETQERGLWGVKIQNITRGSIPSDLPRIGIRSVFILDPRLNFHIVYECNGLIAMAWFYSRRSVIVQYI